MKMQRLSWRQTGRLMFAECRGMWRRLFFFVACLGAGLGAVTLVQSFSSGLSDMARREAKSFLAADIEISGSWELGAADGVLLEKILPPGSAVHMVRELHGMAQYIDSKKPGAVYSSFLVEVKAVPVTAPVYPFYGQLRTQPAGEAAALLADAGALVESSFLARSGLRRGGSFRLGGATLRVAGELLAEPDRVARAFSMGPRVMISAAALEQAALLRAGSRVNHRTLIRLPDGADASALAARLEKELADPSLFVRSYGKMQSSLTASIEQLELYLSCLGVIALFLGGIGVAMIVRSFMAQKLDTIAILQCLGARPRDVRRIYFWQIVLLGVCGSLLGIAAGYAGYCLAAPRVAGWLGFVWNGATPWQPAAQALALGVATALAFSLRPLTQATRIKPVRLLRRVQMEEFAAAGALGQRLLTAAAFAAAVLLLLFRRPESIQRSLVFLLSLAAAAAVFSLLARLSLAALRRLLRVHSMAVKYGLANIHRPNSQAAPIITSLGMGIALVLSIHLTRLDMESVFRGKTAGHPPNYFFIDIQPDQTEAFTRILDRLIPGAPRTLTPLVRARFHSAGQQTVEQQAAREPKEEKWLRREFVLTYMQGALPPGNEITGGQWWGADGSGPQASVEEDAARRFGARVGSTLTMDVQGVKVSAPVTSIRRVDWRNMRTNFYVIFTPAALEGAPATFVGAVDTPPGRELEVQDALASELPNISAISTRDILRNLEDAADKLTAAINFISGFSMAMGLLVLAGAIAVTKYRRLQEAAVLKILGANRARVAAILACEYAGFGVIAAALGALFALPISWGIMRYVVKAAWTWHGAPLLWTLGAASLLTAVAGVLCSLDVICGKPIRVLRHLDGV